MNGFFKLNIANIKSAVVYGLLFFLLSFLLAVVQSIMDAGSIFGLNWMAVVDRGVVATLPILFVGISLVKNLLTNEEGKFLGVTEVIPDKE